LTNKSAKNLGSGEVFSFERLAREEVSLSSFPLGPNGEFVVANSLSLSHLQNSTPQLFKEELKKMDAS
jgi:hypothetical protein